MQAGSLLYFMTSRPARGGWIEITLFWFVSIFSLSRPARGGWIEIGGKDSTVLAYLVPPRTGRVD